MAIDSEIIRNDAELTAARRTSPELVDGTTCCHSLGYGRQSLRSVFTHFEKTTSALR